MESTLLQSYFEPVYKTAKIFLQISQKYKQKKREKSTVQILQIFNKNRSGACANELGSTKKHVFIKERYELIQ